jgi:hypothetical protein
LGVPDMAPVMGAALVTGVVAFTVLYLYLISLRLRVGRLEERVMAEALSPRLGQPIHSLIDPGLDEAESAGREAGPRAAEAPAGEPRG